MQSVRYQHDNQLCKEQEVRSNKLFNPFPLQHPGNKRENSHIHTEDTLD